MRRLREGPWGLGFRSGREERGVHRSETVCAIGYGSRQSAEFLNRRRPQGAVVLSDDNRSEDTARTPSPAMHPWPALPEATKNGTEAWPFGIVVAVCLVLRSSGSQSGIEATASGVDTRTTWLPQSGHVSNFHHLKLGLLEPLQLLSSQWPRQKWHTYPDWLPSMDHPETSLQPVSCEPTVRDLALGRQTPRTC